MNKHINTDIADSKKDAAKLKSEVATINLPDVNDIPGQENIHVAPLGELADVTISSDDEEGKRVFGDTNNYNEELLHKKLKLSAIDEDEEDTDEEDDDDLFDDEDDDLLTEEDGDEIIPEGDENSSEADDTLDFEDDDEEDFFDDEEEEDDDELLNKKNQLASSEMDATVSKEEKQRLQDADENLPTRDEINLKRATLDNVDFDDEPLNVKGFSNNRDGDDLDIANTEDDDINEEIGEEDEENNYYSLGGDNNSDDERDNI